VSATRERPLTGCNSVTRGRATPRRVKTPLVFLIHQSLGAWGPILAAPWVLLFLSELAWHLGWRTYFSQAQWVLYGTPFYPAHVCLALVLGWLLGGALRHRSMLWVWVLPLMELSSAVVGGPRVMAAPMEWSVYPPVDHLTTARWAQMGLTGRLTHLFGWGTGIQPFNQVVLTLPFYSASAYSLGALLARRAVPMSAFFESMRRLRIKRLILLVAAPWFCVKVALISQPTAARYPAMRTWTGLLFVLEPFLVISIFVTLAFAVAVSLLGRRFFLSRFFLCTNEPGGAAEGADSRHTSARGPESKTR